MKQLTSSLVADPGHARGSQGLTVDAIAPGRVRLAEHAREAAAADDAAGVAPESGDPEDGPAVGAVALSPSPLSIGGTGERTYRHAIVARAGGTQDGGRGIGVRSR